MPKRCNGKANKRGKENGVTYATVDRLRVFVSSTIKECARERECTRTAIRSVNHEPILFEDVGARPYPPREMYRTRLEESHIFVAVYRESYGWIAPDMSVSGIEDEFDIATVRGMDRLVYIYNAPGNREPRLQELIDRVRNAGITTSNYSSPEDLESLVRRDVTAVVSSGFMSQTMLLRAPPTPRDVLDSIVPVKQHRFARRVVETEIAETLRRSGRVAITGTLGSGKTVMLAQLALENDWVFVDGRDLGRLDLLASVANAMRKRLDRTVMTVTTEDQAMRLYIDSARRLEPTTIAVDGGEDASALCKLPLEGHRLVFTSRSHLDWLPVARYDLPRLTEDEVVSWVSNMRGEGVPRHEVHKITALSEGNPLYLRFYAIGGRPEENLSLRELEIRAVESLGPREKEIVTYLALSSQPLSLGDLTELLEPEGGPEAVAARVAGAGGLVIEGGRGIQLIHEHLRATLVERLRGLPARWSFFTVRLGAHLERRGHFLSAFHLYLDVEDLPRADRILPKATNQAVLFGGGGIAIRVFRREADLARAMNQHTAEVHALLNLSYALAQCGEGAGASAALEAAQSASVKATPVLRLRVRELAIIVGMRGCGRDVRIDALERLVVEYEDLGESFHAARVRTFLGKEYIDEKRFEDGARVCRAAHQAFREFGDELGVGVALVNLAAALSGIPGKRDEALSIVQEVQGEWSAEEHPRLRAVVCNVLTRHYRESGDLETAAEHALEAIAIGEKLSEHSVTCVNRINLGNVYRDGGKSEKAVEQYELAGKAAQKGDNAEGDGWANELIASVMNDRGEYGLAEHHARYAYAMGSRMRHTTLIARAHEEGAVALAGQGNIEGAIDAYGNACRAVCAGNGDLGFFVSLLCDGLGLIGKHGRTDLKPRFVNGAAVGDGNSDRDADDGDEIGMLYEGLVGLARMEIGSGVVPVVSLAMWDIFADHRGIVERRMVRQAIKELINCRNGNISRSEMGAIVAVLITQSGENWGIEEVVHIAEMVGRASDRLYYKPHRDGAGHWTVRLEVSEGVLITVRQLDDSVRTSLMTMDLALLLGSCDEAIWGDVLGWSAVDARELVVDVCCKEDLDAEFGVETLGLGELKNGFTVVGAGVTATEAEGRFLVVRDGDFGGPWRPMAEGMSDIHKLFGAVICSVATSLLSEEVEQDVLIPKIARLIRSMGYVRE